MCGQRRTWLARRLEGGRPALKSWAASASSDSSDSMAEKRSMRTCSAVPASCTAATPSPSGRAADPPPFQPSKRPHSLTSQLCHGLFAGSANGMNHIDN